MSRGVIFLFFISVQLLIGRENPFAPAQEFEGVDAPTNITVERGEFEQQALSLPSNARVLKYVVFGYQTLNGDVEQMRMEVDKNVDWHDPMVVTRESVLINPPLVTPPVSESSTRTTSVQKAPPKEAVKPGVVKPKPPAKESKEASEAKVEPQPKEGNSVTVGFDELIGFEAFSRRLLVICDDKLLRHFMVADPYKVVLDFEKESAFYTQVLKLNHGAFKQITLGNHNGYYRAAILLDGHYLYEIAPVEGGYEVVLK
jgi:hypothetical protein